MFWTFVLVILVISCGLQFAGHYTRGWLTMEACGNYIEIGLYTIKRCDAQSKCSTQGTVEYFNNSTEYPGTVFAKTARKLFLVETFFGYLMCCFAIQHVVFLHCGCGSKNFLMSVICALTTLSGALSMVAAGSFGVEILKKCDLYQEIDGCVIDFGIPYSPILAGTGGAIAALVCLAILGKYDEKKVPTKQTEAYQLHVLEKQTEAYI